MLNTPLQEVMVQVNDQEKQLVQSMIDCLERNEIDPVLKVLYRWGKEPIKQLLEQFDGKEN